MQVNFTRDEYELLKQYADAAGTSPAWMVHDWVMDRIGLEAFAAQEAKRRVGSRDGMGSNPIPRSNTISGPET